MCLHCSDLCLIVLSVWYILEWWCGGGQAFLHTLWYYSLLMSHRPLHSLLSTLMTCSRDSDYLRCVTWYILFLEPRLPVSLTWLTWPWYSTLSHFDLISCGISTIHSVVWCLLFVLTSDRCFWPQVYSTLMIPYSFPVFSGILLIFDDCIHSVLMLSQW